MLTIYKTLFHCIQGCASSSSSNNDGDYYILFDHSGIVSASETSDATEWMSKIINHGITESSAIGFNILHTYNIPYPIKQKTWLEWTDFVINNISGKGVGFRDIVIGIDTMISQYIQLNNTNLNRKRIALLMTTSIPCRLLTINSSSSSYELVCSEEDYSICDQYEAIFDQNIRVIVIFVNDVNNYNYGCITTDSTQDFIYLNVSDDNAYSSINTITSTVLDAFCPLPSYTLTITEIKATQSSLNINDYENYSAQFIEIYNDYHASINLKHLYFEGLINGHLNRNDTLPSSTYLVIYNADAGNITCKQCNCTKTDNIWCSNAIYVACGALYECQFDLSMVFYINIVYHQIT